MRLQLKNNVCMHMTPAYILHTSIHMYISACTASSKFHVGIHMFTNRYICMFIPYPYVHRICSYVQLYA